MAKTKRKGERGTRRGGTFHVDKSKTEVIENSHGRNKKINDHLKDARIQKNGNNIGKLLYDTFGL
jgi:hypothetical protein